MNIYEMLLANAMGESGGGGGGGSSDFSTAQVTIEITASEEVRVSMASVYEDEGEGEYGTGSILWESGTYTAVLYKGHCFTAVEGTNLEITCTGDIEGSAGAYDITGNCTISIADA